MATVESVATLAQRIAVLEAQGQAQAQLNAAVEGKLSALDARVSDGATRLQSTQSMLQAHNAMHDPYMLKVDALESMVQTLTTQLNDYNKEFVSKIDAKVDEVQNALMMHINAARVMATNHDAAIRQHETAINAAKARVNALGEMQDTLITQLNDPALHGPFGDRIRAIEQRMGASDGNGLGPEITGVLDQLTDQAGKIIALQGQAMQMASELDLLRQMPPGIPPPPPAGEERRPCLARLKSARPAEEKFTGARSEYEEFRKSLISWASADFEQVEGFLDWAEEQSRPITEEEVKAEALGPLGPLLVTFNGQLRRELWSFMAPQSAARDQIDHCGVRDGLEA